MHTEDRTEDTSPKIPAVISSGAVVKTVDVDVLSPNVIQEVGINSSQGTVMDSMEVQMNIMPNKLNKLDMPIIREELVPEELTLTYESETENSSLASVIAEFSNGRIVHGFVWEGVFVQAVGGGWMICHFSIVRVHFVFCQLNFIILFLFLIKYYYILFIIIVF